MFFFLLRKKVISFPRTYKIKLLVSILSLHLWKKTKGLRTESLEKPNENCPNL